MEKKGNDAKIIINIGTAYNVNPSAKVVNNTFNISSGEEGKKVIEETLGSKSKSLSDSFKEPDPRRDLTLVKEKIMEYVDRVRMYDILKPEVLQGYKKMWEEILALPEVEAKICHIGKRQDTYFNRDLVANILYYLRKRKIYQVVYRDGINSAALSRALQGTIDHSVRQSLAKEPPKDIQKALDKYFAMKDA